MRALLRILRCAWWFWLKDVETTVFTTGYPTRDLFSALPRERCLPLRCTYACLCIVGRKVGRAFMAGLFTRCGGAACRHAAHRTQR